MKEPYLLVLRTHMIFSVCFHARFTPSLMANFGITYLVINFVVYYILFYTGNMASVLQILLKLILDTRMNYGKVSPTFCSLHFLYPENVSVRLLLWQKVTVKRRKEVAILKHSHNWQNGKKLRLDKAKARSKIIALQIFMGNIFKQFPSLP